MVNFGKNQFDVFLLIFQINHSFLRNNSSKADYFIEKFVILGFCNNKIQT